MARIIGGSIIGELSGKFAGAVFARNKAGQYMRKYAIPVNPDSQAQSDARSSFATAVTSYHALEPAEKANWTDFAINRYVPVNGTNTGQFSGFNAFVSLNQVLRHAQNMQIASPNWQTDIDYITPASSQAPAFTRNSPHDAIQAQLMNITGDPVLVTLDPDETQIYKNGAFKVKMLLNGGTGPSGVTLSSVLSSNGSNRVGFAVGISNSVTQSGMFFQNPDIMKLGYTPCPTWTSGDVTGISSLGFEGALINIGNYQAFPQMGTIVRVTLYIYSMGGQMIKLDSSESYILDTP